MIAEVTVSGIDFYVEFDYQSKEMETMYQPGCPAEIDITCVKMQDVEIGEIINPYWLGRIEETLMEMH
jgi:hypothetical protein